ncbi:MAG TPA: hypothetical protein VEA69_12905 [Tepidisphaeraceae bacterium]|nr:hypothetical protein [Tepidisphaeraceae bacterium]
MTGAAIIEYAVELFPGFAPQWAASYFRRDDGTFTPCGAFAELSHYVRDEYERLPPDHLARLGRFVSDCAESADADLADAAGACFLENVSGERFDDDFARHLSGRALALYRAHGTGQREGDVR